MKTPSFFEMHSWCLRVLVQLRIWVCRSAVAPEGETSKHGHAFDVMGDLAQNGGKSGHQTRHFELLKELAQRLKSVYGAAVEREPAG